MIIVSQDKREIINFDKTQTLGIESGSGTIIVIEDLFKIGEYATEERAREVLQEIWNFYEVVKRYECNSNNGMTFFLENTFVYEMPKE